MPPVNDSNNIPGSAGGPLVNGNSAGNSSNDNVKKFTFPSHQFHMVHLAKMCQENKGQLFQNVLMKNQFHPKHQRDYFWISALIFFVASWGLPERFLGFLETY